LVFAVAVLVLGIAASSRQPWRTDEHRYIEIAREMVSMGSWLVPHLNGDLYADKPPGFFVAVAAAYRVGVPLGLAGMLPSVFGAGMMLALSFALARRAFGSATAWTTSSKR
jgi:4-amino-4-deoxy-L-arabinose transferase-like glycosyltransferase